MANTDINAAVRAKTLAMRFTGFSSTMAKRLHPDYKKMMRLQDDREPRPVATSCDCWQINLPLDSIQRSRWSFAMSIFTALMQRHDRHKIPGT